MNIKFEKVNHSHEVAIFELLAEPHVMAFWDNSQEHKDDIVKFINGRVESSSYAGGQYTYWIGLLGDIPYCLIMAIKEEPLEERPSIKNAHLSNTGSTYSLDYMIGNVKYVGRGLGASTLEEFVRFFAREVDHTADTFFIDPDLANPRAKRVYEKAGFEFIENFILGGTGVFAGNTSSFMVKKVNKSASHL